MNGTIVRPVPRKLPAANCRRPNPRPKNNSRAWISVGTMWRCPDCNKIWIYKSKLFDPTWWPASALERFRFRRAERLGRG